MSNDFQKIITVKIPLHVRLKPNGVYEARFRSGGYNISVSSKKYSRLKPKFLSALENYNKPKEADEPLREFPTPEKAVEGKLFTDIAHRWLELKAPTIKQRTYDYYVQLFGANILPVLGFVKLESTACRARLFPSGRATLPTAQ